MIDEHILSLPPFPSTYVIVKELVEIIAAVEFIRLTVNAGTGKFRLTIAVVARSSKIGFEVLTLTSRRIRLDVRRVIRVRPTKTCAKTFATGLYSRASVCIDKRVVKKRRRRNI